MRIKLFLIIIKRWIEEAIIVRNRKKKKVRFLYYFISIYVTLCHVISVSLNFVFIVLFYVILNGII